jgi:tail tube protein
MSRVDSVGLAVQPAGMGTKVTTMEYWVPVESSAVNDNAQTLTIQETIGSRFATGLDYGTRFFDVPMAGAPRASSFPRILSGFLGNPSSVADVHTFDPTAANSIPEPHSIFAIRNDPKAAGQPAIVDLFWDARGNELQINIAANDYVKMSAAWIALDIDEAQAAPVATYDTSKRFKFSQVVVGYSTGGLAGLASPTAITASSAGVTYQNNLDTDEAVLGSRKLFALPTGNADAEVRFSTRSDMAGFYRRAMLADPTDIAFKMTATGASPDVLEITVAACQEISAPAPVDGSSVLKQIDVTATVHLDDTSGKFFSIAVTNDVTSYAAGPLGPS